MLVGLDAVEMATVPSISRRLRAASDAGGVTVDELTTKPRGASPTVKPSANSTDDSFTVGEPVGEEEGSRANSTDFLSTGLTMLVLLVGVLLLLVGSLWDVSSGGGVGSMSSRLICVAIVSSPPSNGPQPKRAEWGISGSVGDKAQSYLILFIITAGVLLRFPA